MNGGECATRGKNLLKLCKKSSDTTTTSASASGALIAARVIDRDLSRLRDSVGDWDRVVNLGGKSTVHVHPGDRLVILTPGGGGYGCTTATEITSPWDTHMNTGDAASVPVKQSGSLNQYTLNQES
jgi:N-methylhydantoinase B/oxoprolinase/acetone carboxylase alpha subunit